ncbi:hypothetical protein WKH56_20375 [Priestia sp. SB1]|uniref:hypothetical protein n=1 Tax=Priestia sp. SB1 TaxID=3132359 RepID=UPI0031821FE2
MNPSKRFSARDTLKTYRYLQKFIFKDYYGRKNLYLLLDEDDAGTYAIFIPVTDSDVVKLEDEEFTIKQLLETKKYIFYELEGYNNDIDRMKPSELHDDYLKNLDVFLINFY